MDNSNNNNIIDFFTRKSIDKLTEEDYQHISKLVENSGVYLGVLKKNDSETLRKYIKEIHFLDDQMNALVQKRDKHYLTYREVLQKAVNFLAKDNPVAKKVKIEHDEFVIDENGHVWVIFGSELD